MTVTERGRRRFLFALYYALRDCTPEERDEVIAAAKHDAECPGNCETAHPDYQYPDWWPAMEEWDRYPYAALAAWAEGPDEEDEEAEPEEG